MKTKDLIEEAASLPVEERALLVDSLLRSLNQPQADVDEKWADTAKKRLEDLRSGAANAVPGDVVFEKNWKRFEQ